MDQQFILRSISQLYILFKVKLKIKPHSRGTLHMGKEFKAKVDRVLIMETM